jgi:hypothetical protein
VKEQPVTNEESTFTSWQEGARKDVERAFGVLQGMWKAVPTPIHTLEPYYLAAMVSCCLILHNMVGVSDRVMGDVKAKYDPGSVVKEVGVEEVEEDDGSCPAESIGASPVSHVEEVIPATTTGAPTAFEIEPARIITQRDEMKGLTNEAECIRLQKAVISCVNDSSWRLKN